MSQPVLRVYLFFLNNLLFLYNGTRNYVHWQEWRYDADEWGWQLISGTWDSPT